MRSLRFRVFAAIGLVSLLGLVIGATVTRSLAPESFARRLGQGFGRRAEAAGSDLEALFLDALQQGLLVGLIAALAAALLVGALIARLLTRSISEVRAATRRLASGDYSIRIPTQHVSELVELGNDINTLAGALDETERRRTQLIGNVAHELRTPLTTIEGYMEGLSDGVLEPSAEIYATVGGEAARLRRLTNDLVRLSEAEERSTVAKTERVPMGSLVRQVAERLRPQFTDQQVELAVTIPDDPVVLGSSDQLTQVVTNVLGNALGHTPPGGRVEVETATRKGTTVVTVSDTGEGIPPAELDRIFERFYRVTDTPPLVGRRPGSGIGLTIARSIARAHGGEITAASEGPGTGAAFTITLPEEIA